MDKLKNELIEHLKERNYSGYYKHIDDDDINNIIFFVKEKIKEYLKKIKLDHYDFYNFECEQVQRLETLKYKLIKELENE